MACRRAWGCLRVSLGTLGMVTTECGRSVQRVIGLRWSGSQDHRREFRLGSDDDV